MSQTETSSPKQPEPLEKGWRIALLVVAAALMLLAALSWYLPPTKLEFAPQATTATETRDVKERSETTTVLLIGLALLCFVIAANGRKLTSVKIAGAEISTDDAEAATAAATEAALLAMTDGLGENAARNAAKSAHATVISQAATGDVKSLDLHAIAESAVDEAKSSR
jgi:hypothetical protein